MMATHWVSFGTLLAISIAAQASGQAPTPKPAPSPATAERSADEKAIRALVEAFVGAFGRGDAKAIAGLFTEQGEAIDTAGEAIRGRAALEAHYASRFEAYPGEKIEATIDLIHFLAPEVARQDGRSKIIPSGNEPAVTAHYTATLLKSQGRWLITSIRELEDPTITPHDRLKELEWLIGDWIEETGDARVETSVVWSEDKNYLLRSFDVKLPNGKTDLKGTQRIGWDPLTKQIKSWVFDSLGGHGEGYWTRGEDRWTIKSTGVQPDGLTTSAVQTLTRVKKDHLFWTSTNRTLGGEALEDDHELMMVRKPPQPK